MAGLPDRFLRKLEPEITSDMTYASAIEMSKAISMKRLADWLHNLDSEQVAAFITDVVKRVERETQ